MNITKKNRIGKLLVGTTLSLSIAFSGGMLVMPPSVQAATVSNSTITDNVISTGKQFLGVPYQFGAKSGRTDVFDCSSFTQYVFKQNGIYIPRSSRQQANVGVPVSKSQLQAGDLVFSDTNRDGIINHVGIYMGNGQILHTYRVGIGVTISKYTGSTWERTFVTARRVIPNNGQALASSSAPAPAKAQSAITAPAKKSAFVPSFRPQPARSWSGDNQQGEN